MNEISNIDVLEKVNYPDLKELRLNNNKIKDISVLEYVNFDKLQILYLSDNLITNISVLEKVDFDQLRELWLFNNKIMDINSLNSEISALKDLCSELIEIYGSSAVELHNPCNPEMLNEWEVSNSIAIPAQLKEFLLFLPTLIL